MTLSNLFGKAKYERRENAFRPLFEAYDRLMIFDTETTGLHYETSQIIQFSAVVLDKDGNTVEYDNLITLDPGTVIPDKIVELTHITNEAVAERGISKKQLCEDIADLMAGNTLLIAYNAHFDLCFTYYLLKRHGDPGILQGKDKLDLLSVYRDRHFYPHKLKSAIEQYNLTKRVVNSHRAIDDVYATVAVMDYLERERNDLIKYVNLFGYNLHFPIPKNRIRSVIYLPQDYHPDDMTLYQRYEEDIKLC